MKKLALAMVLSAVGAAFAETAPVMVSLVTPVQAPAAESDVKGLRLSLIYGECADFTGLDIGLANRAAGDFTGLAVGGVNIAGKEFNGGQVGLVNWNGNADFDKVGEPDWAHVSKGCQFGLLNYAPSFCGLQDGIVNVVDDTFTGLQSGLVNITHDLYGCQSGLYIFLCANFATGTVRGCQLGLLNYAREMDRGLQVGIVNIVSEGGWAPVLPLVNGRF